MEKTLRIDNVIYDAAERRFKGQVRLGGRLIAASFASIFFAPTANVRMGCPFYRGIA
jgi:hypothetical protein